MLEAHGRYSGFQHAHGNKLRGQDVRIHRYGQRNVQIGYDHSTIEFTSDGENSQVAATYSLDWKYSGNTSKNSSSQYYLPVNLTGNLTGAIEHEFGKDNFSIELNDAENQVTFTGGESYATISAGDGESNTMSLSAATNTKYFESPFQTSTYRMSMGTYVEKA